MSRTKDTLYGYPGCFSDLSGEGVCLYGRVPEHPLDYCLAADLD